MWLGEALGELDRFDEAEEAFVRAEALTERSGECWAEAELFRIWAAERRRSGAAGAAALHERALSVAHHQGAAAFAVRVALDRATEDPAVAARLRDLLERHPAAEWSPEFIAAGRLVGLALPADPTLV